MLSCVTSGSNTVLILVLAAALIASLPTPPVLTPYGFQWVDLNAFLVADVGAVDPQGHRQLSIAMPLGYPLGEPLVFQSIVLDQGALVWSTPSAIVRN